MNRKIAIMITAFVFMASFLINDMARAEKEVRLTWIAGGVGGGWYVMAAGVAKIIEEKAPHIKISVVPGGGVANQPVVGTNKAEIGWALPPFAVAARTGTDPYTEKFEDIMAVGGSFSDNFQHDMAAVDTGVTTLRGLVEYSKPIRIGPGRIGVSGEFTFRKVLEEYFRSSYDDIKKKGGKVFHTGYPEIATNLKDRHIDFANINIAPPASVILEANIGRKLRLLPWPDDILKMMKEKYRFGIGTIKKEWYADILTEDVPTSTMGTAIIVHKSVEDDVVYQITKIMCENSDRLPAIHKSMEVFKPATAWMDMPAPLHPGAIRYYKEKGYMK